MTGDAGDDAGHWCAHFYLSPDEPAVQLQIRMSAGGLMLIMLGAVAEFEHALMLERQRECIAKAEGKYQGRIPTAQRQAAEVLKLKAGGMKPTAIAQQLGIGRASVYRIFEGQDAATPAS